MATLSSRAYFIKVAAREIRSRDLPKRRVQHLGRLFDSLSDHDKRAISLHRHMTDDFWNRAFETLYTEIAPTKASEFGSTVDDPEPVAAAPDASEDIKEGEREFIDEPAHISDLIRAGEHINQRFLVFNKMIQGGINTLADIKRELAIQKMAGETHMRDNGDLAIRILKLNADGDLTADDVIALRSAAQGLPTDPDRAVAEIRELTRKVLAAKMGGRRLPKRIRRGAHQSGAEHIALWHVMDD